MKSCKIQPQTIPDWNPQLQQRTRGISGLNATDKTSMHEIPLTFVFWGFGVGKAIFVLGYWALAFWHWRFVSRSTWGNQYVPGHGLARLILFDRISMLFIHLYTSISSQTGLIQSKVCISRGEQIFLNNADDTKWFIIRVQCSCIDLIETICIRSGWWNVFDCVSAFLHNSCANYRTRWVHSVIC